MARRVRHDHYHHRGGRDGEWILWLIGLFVAVLVLRVLFWIAVVAIGAWLIYVLRRPILILLVIVFRGVVLLLNGIARLFQRRSPTPKLLTHAQTPPSD